MLTCLWAQLHNIVQSSHCSLFRKGATITWIWNTRGWLNSVKFITLNAGLPLLYFQSKNNFKYICVMIWSIIFHIEMFSWDLTALSLDTSILSRKLCCTHYFVRGDVAFAFILKAWNYISGSTLAKCGYFAQLQKMWPTPYRTAAFKTVQKPYIDSRKFEKNVTECLCVNMVRTSLTDRNSNRGKTRCRSKKWAILVVRSYSAIFAPGKGKRMCVVVAV